MICCSECFRDEEIRAAISAIGHKGNCPLCGKKNSWIYDTSKDKDNSNVQEMLDSILEIYQPSIELPDTFPLSGLKNIEDCLCKDWAIFNIDSLHARKIIEAIIQESFRNTETLLNYQVGIPELFDKHYLSLNSILGSNSWSEFKDYLRDENRFHSKHINLNLLADVLKEAELLINAGTIMYRARISGENGYEKNDMGAPPKEKATPGRANSEGQVCLYLCSNKSIAIKEVRAGAFDYVTVASFKLKQNIRVLDLSSIAHNSPFYKDTNKINFLINDKWLREIQMDLAKPMSSLDSRLDYLPTQYIIDFARFLGYDGVKYISTFSNKEYNLAIFNKDRFDYTYRKVYRIGNLEYALTPINPNA